MKILIVRTFPSIINLNNYNVQEIGLAKALTLQNNECGIVFYNGNHSNREEKIFVDCEGKQREIIVYYLKGYNFLKNGFFPSLGKIVKGYDVIQVHEYDQITSWLYYAWSKKKVVIYHGPYFHPFNKGYNLKCEIFDHTFLKIKQNKNILCFTKSNAAADFLRQKGFENPVPIGVGLDLDVFSEDTRGNSEEKQDKHFTWIYVGKLEPRRNILFLVEIMIALATKYTEMEFVIVGNGEYDYKQKCMKKMIPLMESGRLKYIESVSQKELSELYRNVDAMLFPSVYEIFGMVLMEAIYFELPIISSENGGADMLLENGENGFIINDFAINKWIEAAEKLYLDKDLYKKMKDNLNKDKYKMLSWDAIAKRMLEAYDQYGLMVSDK